MTTTTITQKHTFISRVNVKAWALTAAWLIAVTAMGGCAAWIYVRWGVVSEGAGERFLADKSLPLSMIAGTMLPIIAMLGAGITIVALLKRVGSYWKIEQGPFAALFIGSFLMCIAGAISLGLPGSVPEYGGRASDTAQAVIDSGVTQTVALSADNALDYPGLKDMAEGECTLNQGIYSGNYRTTAAQAQICRKGMTFTFAYYDPAAVAAAQQAAAAQAAAAATTPAAPTPAA